MCFTVRERGREEREIREREEREGGGGGEREVEHREDSGELEKIIKGETERE